MRVNFLKTTNVHHPSHIPHHITFQYLLHCDWSTGSVFHNRLGNTSDYQQNINNPQIEIRTVQRGERLCQIFIRQKILHFSVNKNRRSSCATNSCRIGTHSWIACTNLIKYNEGIGGNGNGI